MASTTVRIPESSSGIQLKCFFWWNAFISYGDCTKILLRFINVTCFAQLDLSNRTIEMLLLDNDNGTFSYVYGIMDVGLISTDIREKNTL